VLEHDNFCDATNQKTSQRAEPAIPEKTSEGWQTKAHQYREEVNMSMLPHHQRIFLQIGHIIERRLGPQLKQQPADMRVEKTLSDVVRVFVVIDMFMMSTMLARPHQN
jgi:hypothetical protein